MDDKFFGFVVICIIFFVMRCLRIWDKSLMIFVLRNDVSVIDVFASKKSFVKIVSLLFIFKFNVCSFWCVVVLLSMLLCNRFVMWIIFVIFVRRCCRRRTFVGVWCAGVWFVFFYFFCVVFVIILFVIVFVMSIKIVGCMCFFFVLSLKKYSFVVDNAGISFVIVFCICFLIVFSLLFMILNGFIGIVLLYVSFFFGIVCVFVNLMFGFVRASFVVFAFVAFFFLFCVCVC